MLEPDKKLFEELAHATRSGIQTTLAGRPLDVQFEACMNKAEVAYLLQSLASKHADVCRVEKETPVRPSPYSQDGAKRKGKGKKGNKGLQNNPECLLHWSKEGVELAPMVVTRYALGTILELAIIRSARVGVKRDFTCVLYPSVASAIRISNAV